MANNSSPFFDSLGSGSAETLNRELARMEQQVLRFGDTLGDDALEAIARSCVAIQIRAEFDPSVGYDRLNGLALANIGVRGDMINREAKVLTELLDCLGNKRDLQSPFSGFSFPIEPEMVLSVVEQLLESQISAQESRKLDPSIDDVLQAFFGPSPSGGQGASSASCVMSEQVEARLRRAVSMFTSGDDTIVQKMAYSLLSRFKEK